MAKQKKTPALKNLITVAALAHLAQVTRQAANAWIKNHESQGIVLTQPSGRRGKLVDRNNPLVRRYINNTLGKSNRAGQGSDSEDRSPHTLRKLRLQIEKTNLATASLRENHIPREVTLAVFNELLTLEEKLFAKFSDSVMREIKRNLGINTNLEKEKTAKQVLDDALSNTHLSNLWIAEDYRRKTGPRNGKEKTA